MNALVDLSKAPLATQTTSSGSTITVTLNGSAESEVMSELSSYLRDLHMAALAAGAKEVVLDMRKLEFMSSSCLKAFVMWINILKTTGEGSRYKVRFMSDASKHWQARSLTALTHFAIELITVEVS